MIMNKNNELKKEEKEMAVLTKPTVYEVKTTKENRDEILRQIHEPRLTKEFLEQCMKVSKKLRDADDQ